MASIEFDIICKWHSEGEYVPEKVNAPYEDCYPAEYPDIILDEVYFDGSEEPLKLTDDDYDVLFNLVADHVQSADEVDDRISFTHSFDCELDIDKTVSYNGQDITEFVEEDYINELFS